MWRQLPDTEEWKFMNRIKEAFENKKALIPFITGGDPNLEVTKKLLPAMQEAGADLIEIGIPFSDPIAEGPVIQEADERALEAGCTTDKLFDAIEEVREQIKIPVVFMTYANPIFAYGKKKFMQRCVKSGIAGVIVPDIPYEEKEELSEVCGEYGVELVSLIAPTSGERVKTIAKEAQGFLYCVASTAGECEISANIRQISEQVKEVSDIPCAIEAGIATPQQVREVAAAADGVIIGSAVVEIAAEHGENCVPYVVEYIREMKAAMCEV